MVQTANTVFRDFETDGVMASGKHQPKKSEIRPLLTRLENIYDGALAGGGLVYETKTDLDADTTQVDNAMAWVLGDDTVTNNGIYQFDGAAWTRLGDLPYSYIAASNAGAGTANAIVATTSIPIPSADGGALIALPIVATNDASPVTASFNGAAALTVKTSSGNDVSVGGLTAGMIAAGYVSGTTFRLLTDQASAAIVADAEAAADRAEAAASDADETLASAVKRAETDASSFGFVAGEGDTPADPSKALPTVERVDAETVYKVADRTALKAVDTTAHTVVYLLESGREGQFVWSSSDLSTEVAEDPSEYTYVAPSNDPTGASGAWVFVDALDLRFDPATNAILPKNHSDFSLINPVIKFGENLSGYDSWRPSETFPQGYNIEGFGVDLGGFGPSSYGIYSTPVALIGKLMVPAEAKFWQANAVVGLVESASPDTKAVAIYGETTLSASGTTAWGGNSGVSFDAAHEDNIVIGWEFDVSVHNAKSNAQGIYIVGASSARPDGTKGKSRAVHIAALGINQVPPIPWDIAYETEAGAADVFASIGPKLFGQPSRSQKIEWYYIDASSVRSLGPSWDVDAAGSLFFVGSPSGGATYWENYVGGVKTTAMTLAGGSLGVGPVTPAYRFHVSGASKLDGQVGFQGSNPIARPDVTGSVAGNAALTSLLTALASYGLITNSTTA